MLRIIWQLFVVRLPVSLAGEVPQVEESPILGADLLQAAFLFEAETLQPLLQPNRVVVFEIIQFCITSSIALHCLLTGWCLLDFGAIDKAFIVANISIMLDLQVER